MEWGVRYALCRYWHGAWKKMSEGTDMQGTPPTDLRAQSLRLRHSCVHGNLCVGRGSVFVYPCQHATPAFPDCSSSRHVRDLKMILLQQELSGCVWHLNRNHIEKKNDTYLITLKDHTASQSVNDQRVAMQIILKGSQVCLTSSHPAPPSPRV